MRKCSTPPIDHGIYELCDFIKNSDFSGGLNICSWIYDPNTKTPCWTI